MVLAGIDEAGYGPLLGPLVSASAAFEVVTADAAAETPAFPDLWKILGRVVSAKRQADGRKIHVNDSKRVYSPAAGIGELERAVLCMLGRDIATMEDAFRRCNPALVADLARYPWYRPAADERFPLRAELLSVRMMSNAFHAECERKQARMVHYATHVLCEREYNRFAEVMRNKANVIAMLVFRHIAALIERFAGQGLMIVCDRLGGRSKYGSLLRTHFEEWHLTIDSETSSRADYTLTRTGQRVRVIFSEKGEMLALPVAAASMLAKYQRELLMHRFNAYWAVLAPRVAPTAGYFTDGVRFLDETKALRASLGIADEELVRSR